MCPLSLAFAVGILSSPVAQDPSGLLPTDAAVIVRLESLDAVYASVSRLAELFHFKEDVPGEDALPPKDAFLSESLSLSIDAAQIDPTRPIYMATDVVLGPPSPSFLLPALDVAELTAAIAAIGKTPVVRGDWLGFSMQPTYEPADTNPRAAAMLPGVLAASIDLEELFETFGGLIEMGLASAEQQMAQMPAAETGGIDVQAALDLYLDGFRAFMDSAESLDLALHEDGQELALHAVYTAFEDSELDGWGSAGSLPESLPAAIDPEAQLVTLVVADLGDLMARLEPLMDAALAIYPAEVKPGFDAYWAALVDAYALLGDTMVGSGGFGEHGMHFAFHATAEDSKAFVEKFAASIEAVSSASAPMGLASGAPAAIEVGGLKAQQWPIDIDYQVIARVAGQSADAQAAAQLETFFETMYGEHPTFTLAEQSGRICMIFGGEPADLERDVARFVAGPVPAAPFFAGLRGLPAAPRPLIAYRMDFGSLLRCFEPILAAQGTPVDLPEVPFSLTSWLGVEGRRWHVGLGARQDELGGLIKAFKEQ